MDAVREDVKKLVKKELESANENFPLFSSRHEGYAVIKEELEEAEAELKNVNDAFRYLWMAIKDSWVDKNTAAELIREKSINLAIEATQVAAMAEKFIQSE